MQLFLSNYVNVSNHSWFVCWFSLSDLFFFLPKFKKMVHFVVFLENVDQLSKGKNTNVKVFLCSFFLCVKFFCPDKAVQHNGGDVNHEKNEQAFFMIRYFRSSERECAWHGHLFSTHICMKFHTDDLDKLHCAWPLLINHVNFSDKTPVEF